MKYFSCQPDSHNAFVSFSNCTLSYFSVDSPHYRSLASAAAASATSTPVSSPLVGPSGRAPRPSPSAAAAAGPSPTILAADTKPPFRGAADESFYPFNQAGDDFFSAAANDTSYTGGYHQRNGTSSSFAHLGHLMDGIGPSTWNRNMSGTRLHIQHVVTLPDSFHSPNACFGIANHSLFGVDMTVIGTSTGLLALVVPRERTVIYARGKDPAGVRDARQRVRQAAAAAAAAATSPSSLSPSQNYFASQAEKTALSEGLDDVGGGIRPATDTSSRVVLEVPTTITWMRDLPILLVGYNTGLVEWYEVRVHAAKAREFTDPNMETAYGPPLPANALMQYVNNPNACPIERLYRNGVGDGVSIECTACVRLTDSGPLTSSDHFPATGHCVISAERGVYVFSATQPGPPLCRLGHSGADFLYCHPCLPFIATLTYSWNAKQFAMRQQPPREHRGGTSSPKAQPASPTRNPTSGFPSSSQPPPRDQQRRTASPVRAADSRGSTTAAEAANLLRNNDCVLHVYEFVERSPPTAPANTPGSAVTRASAAAEVRGDSSLGGATATGPRVMFRVDDEDGSGLEGVRSSSRLHRTSQRTARYQLVPVLERLVQASLPRYGAYFSLSWKFSFDLELVVCNAEEGSVRVLRLAKRAVGVHCVPPLAAAHPMSEGGAGGGGGGGSAGSAAYTSRDDSPHRDTHTRLHPSYNQQSAGGTYHASHTHGYGTQSREITTSTESLPSQRDRTTGGQQPPHSSAHKAPPQLPYVVVHEHRLRLPLHSLINVEYVSAATSTLEATSLLSTASWVVGAVDGKRHMATAGAADGTVATAAHKNGSSPLHSFGNALTMPLQTLGATTRMSMPPDASRAHNHTATLFTKSFSDERGLQADLAARRSQWQQSMRGSGTQTMGPFAVTMSAARSATRYAGFPAAMTTMSAPQLAAQLPSSSLLLKENLLAAQLLQPTQKLTHRRSGASRSHKSSLGRSRTHHDSSYAAASSVVTSVGGGRGAGVSLSNAPAAAMATLQSLLRVGAGRFSTCVGMTVAGEIAVVPVDREASTTWHDEGSVFVGLGSTLCAADIVTIQGIERHMKRRMEKGFGISAKSSLAALRTVAPAHRDTDMEVLFSFVDLMEKAGLAASFGPVPSIEEFVTWPTRPSLKRLVRHQCLPSYVVRQLRSASQKTDTRRLLLLHVLHWLPCSSRVPHSGTSQSAQSRPGTHDERAHGGAKSLPEWKCGDEVRVNALSTKVEVERAAAVEVLHGRLREGARLLLDYQSLDVTFCAMATLLTRPDDTHAALQNSDNRVREAFLRSLSPWMLVMLLSVCRGAQAQEPQETRASDSARPHPHKHQAAVSGAANSTPNDQSTTRANNNNGVSSGGRSSLMELVKDYRANVLRHRGIPLWDRVAIAVILEPHTTSLIHAFRTYLAPDCTLLQALLLEHGISVASYPHIQELVDCSGNFQLAACLYARVGAVTPAALELAAMAARTCTAWKLSGTHANADDDDDESDDDDERDEDRQGTDTHHPVSYHHNHSTGDKHAHRDEPFRTHTGDVANAATALGDADVDMHMDDYHVIVRLAGVAEEEEEAQGAAREGERDDDESSTAPVVRADKVENLGAVTTSSPATAATPMLEDMPPRMGSDVVPSATGGRSTSALATAARTGVPGTPLSPAYDPYVTFSPTLSRIRQFSLVGSVSSPPLGGSPNNVSGMATKTCSGGVDATVAAPTGSSHVGSRASQDRVAVVRADSEATPQSGSSAFQMTTPPSSPPLFASSSSNKNISATEMRGTGEGFLATTPSPRRERLQRLLKRSQLPAMAPELCDFGAPLAPMTITSPLQRAQRADDGENPNRNRGTTHTIPGASRGTSGAVATTMAASRTEDRANVTALSGADAMTGTPLSGGEARATLPNYTAASAPAPTTLTTSAAGVPIRAGATASPSSHGDHHTASVPNTAAPDFAVGTLSRVPGATLSPSAQRDLALRELIFGHAVSTMPPAVSSASFSNQSFTTPSQAATPALPTFAGGNAGRDAFVGGDGSNPWLWWVEAYRSFLDSEQAFVKRTTFDIECRRLEQLAEEAVAAAAEAAEYATRPPLARTSETAHTSRRGGRTSGSRGGGVADPARRRRQANIPSSIVVVADGTGLRQPLEKHQKRNQNRDSSGAAAEAAAVVAAAANVVIVDPTSADVVQRCVCGEHHFLTSQPLRMLLLAMTAGLPHCSVCDEVIQPVPAKTMSTAVSGAKDGETTAALGWCTACMHGGHTNHLRSWFVAHKRCPVDGCSCHCNEESNLF